MYASVAQCDRWDDMDTKCLMAGLPDDDSEEPRDLCSKATDGEGEGCIWCNVAFGTGVCMDATQAQAAGDGTTSTSLGSNIVELAPKSR